MKLGSDASGHERQLKSTFSLTTVITRPRSQLSSLHASFLEYTRKWCRPNRRRHCHMKALLCLDLYLWRFTKILNILELYTLMYSPVPKSLPQTQHQSSAGQIDLSVPAALLQCPALGRHLLRVGPVRVHRARASLWNMAQAGLRRPGNKWKQIEQFSIMDD